MSLERLDLSVALKLAFVQDSLTEVEEYQAQLHRNAQKAKEEIHEVVDRQIGSLRMRERQLVRQVEVVTAHEACLLSTQQARLMHSKGALTATSSLLQSCSSSDTNTLSKINVDEMYYPEEIQQAKHVSVKLDESVLSSAISQFGSVQLPDTITHHPSPVIPIKAEEYEDEEHDVLHKSVACAANSTGTATTKSGTNENSGSSGPINIRVQFPRLNTHHSTWLHSHTNKQTQEPQEKSDDVAAWLGKLQLSASTHAGEDEGSLFQGSEGFDMVGTPPTSEGSSIEVVSFPSTKGCTSPVGSELCEIENIHHLVSDKSRWLSRTPSSETKVMEKLDVTSVCQANETCRSFNDCVCQNKCKENALEKLRQTEDFKAKTRKRTFDETQGINSILSHMAEILTSENSQWLLGRKQECVQTNRLAKSAMYKAPGGQWLQQVSKSSTSFSSPIKPFTRSRLSSHSNTWLLKNLKNQKNNQEKDEMEKENYVNEKDDTTASEDLSETLKRIRLNPTKTELAVNDEKNHQPYSCLSLPVLKEKWLLTRTVDSNKLTAVPTHEGNKVVSKYRILYSPPSFTSTAKVIKEDRSVPKSRLVKQILSSAAHCNNRSWLLH